MTTLIIVAMFLAGMGIGDIVSKTKQANTHQANTHYVALISYPNGQE
jgi:predicted membrane-bound spermidine synthase